MSEKVVIVGAGHAAGILVQQLARAGERFSITVIGDEAWPPYERPPLSKKLLTGEIAPEKTFLRPVDYYADKGVRLVTGRVTAIDRTAKTVATADGASTAYDDLVLCTGTRNRTIPVPGADLAGVHYIRTLDETAAIRAEAREGARVVIVGGGYIGLEAAASLTQLGCTVTVIEMVDRVMARAVAEPVSRFYEAEHRAKGVTLLLGTGVSAFTGAGGRVNGVTDNTGTTHPADLVIVGIGVVPNTELAAAAGLAVDNGIVVDDTARTSDPAIFAAGDCTSHPNAILGRTIRLESVQNAVDQARCVADQLTGKGGSYAEVPWFWSDQFDLKMQMAGLPLPDDTIVVRGDPATRSFSTFALRDNVVTGVVAVNASADYVRGRKWIGEKREIDPARLSDTAIPIKEV
ncbi:MAG: FAD-dependent oxidoreductase [Pseudomonadota bacterium]|nr:FAD-dependent oxidoreductase [Pseudomonadota bacterium]